MCADMGGVQRLSEGLRKEDGVLDLGQGIPPNLRGGKP